jgi:hypothetical protein
MTVAYLCLTLWRGRLMHKIHAKVVPQLTAATTGTPLAMVVGRKDDDSPLTTEARIMHPLDSFALHARYFRLYQQGTQRVLRHRDYKRLMNMEHLLRTCYMIVNPYWTW